MINTVLPFNSMAAGYGIPASAETMGSLKPGPTGKRLGAFRIRFRLKRLSASMSWEMVAKR